VRSFSPRRIAIVSSTDGSPTSDGLEAPLERGVLLDVLAVLVAPTARSSPRVSIGLSRLPMTEIF